MHVLTTTTRRNLHLVPLGKFPHSNTRHCDGVVNVHTFCFVGGDMQANMRLDDKASRMDPNCGVGTGNRMCWTQTAVLGQATECAGPKLRCWDRQPNVLDPSCGVGTGNRMCWLLVSFARPKGHGRGLDAAGDPVRLRRSHTGRSLCSSLYRLRPTWTQFTTVSPASRAQFYFTSVFGPEPC
jgi:hypothetical protein